MESAAAAVVQTGAAAGQGTDPPPPPLDQARRGRRAGWRRRRGVLRELFVRPSPMVRRIITNVLVLYSFQQASGIDAIVLYIQLVLKKVGISSTSTVLAATIAVRLVKTLSIFVATFLSDRLGRRPLLLASAAGMAVTLTSLGIALLCAGRGDSETTPAAACVASVLAFVTCSVISMTFISPANTITMAGCFFLYASTAVAAAVFIYVRLPETKGRSLERSLRQVITWDIVQDLLLQHLHHRSVL